MSTASISLASPEDIQLLVAGDSLLFRYNPSFPNKRGTAKVFKVMGNESNVIYLTARKDDLTITRMGFNLSSLVLASDGIMTNIKDPFLQEDYLDNHKDSHNRTTYNWLSKEFLMEDRT